MLRETVQFYTLAESHEKVFLNFFIMKCECFSFQLSTKTIEIVQQINEQNSQQLQSSIDKLINGRVFLPFPMLITSFL